MANRLCSSLIAKVDVAGSSAEMIPFGAKNQAAQTQAMAQPGPIPGTGTLER